MVGLRELASRVERGDLDWLVQIVWPRADSLVSQRRARPSSSARRSEQFVVFPSPRRPLIVVPMLVRRSMIRALLARPLLQSRANLLVRVGAAAATTLPARMRSRIAPTARADPGSPAADLGSPAAADSGAALFTVLADALGRRVRPLVILGPRDPNRKPMLELVDDAGRAVGFAKVGWNAPTRELVRNEAATLRHLARATPGSRLPGVSRLLLAEQVDGLEILVTAPMAWSTRRWPNSAPPAISAIASVAAALTDNGALGTQSLRDLTTMSRQQIALAQIRGPDRHCADVLSRVLTSAWRSIRSDVVVAVGGWHGDWAPWNLGRVGRHLWAWDWEHSAPDVPLGFDALHYVFTVMLNVDRLDTEAAVARLRQRSVDLLAELNVPAAAVDAVVTSYLVERWLRAYRLHEDGGGWDPAIQPGLVEALQRGC